MKKVIFFIIVFFVFLFIFFKSNTWETYQETGKKRGLDYIETIHVLHWDRFFDYIKNIPKKILESNVLKPLPIKK